MQHTPLLHIRAEPDRDLVEIPSEHAPIPHGRPVPDRHLASEHDVRGDVGVDGDLWEPLSEGDDPPLAAVVPLDPVQGRGDRRGRAGGSVAGEREKETLTWNTIEGAEESSRAKRIGI